MHLVGMKMYATDQVGLKSEIRLSVTQFWEFPKLPVREAGQKYQTVQVSGSSFVRFVIAE